MDNRAHEHQEASTTDENPDVELFDFDAFRAGYDFDSVGGPALGAIPVAISTALATNKRAFTTTVLIRCWSGVQIPPAVLFVKEEL